MMKYPKKDFKTARDWHIYHVYNDPAFDAAVRTLDFAAPDYPAKQAATAEQFGVTARDVWLYEIRHLLPVTNETRRGSLSFKTGKYTLTWGLDMTKEEYDQHWAAFAALRDELSRRPTSRRKPPENPALIYAIFRARRALTYSEIFELYALGALPGYTGSTEQFGTVESLERYYRKYAPSSSDS